MLPRRDISTLSAVAFGDRAVLAKDWNHLDSVVNTGALADCDGRQQNVACRAQVLFAESLVLNC